MKDDQLQDLQDREDFEANLAYWEEQERLRELDRLEDEAWHMGADYDS